MRKPTAPTDETTPITLPEAFQVNRAGLPVALFTLRQKLYGKAKREPTFRFYTVYSLIYRLDVLEAAWALVAANDGAPGVDGVTIQSIADTPGGSVALVATLHEELRSKRYRPQAVKRVYIPKANGKRRPLGIPTVRDRVVQTAAKLLLEPIFEADFLEASYGYRPGRTAHAALRAIACNVRDGYTAIYDADLQAYFDTIPHDQLLQAVERRVADRSVLRLLRQWLTAPVEERDERGRPRRSRPTRGTPQGGVISPLLANLYLHWFDVVFHRRQGPGTWANARLVRFADDFVIMAKAIDRRLEQWVESTLEGWLKLTINREKTRIVRLTPEGTARLDFLGYTFQYEWDRYGRGTRYFTAVPSPQAVAHAQDAVRALLNPRRNFLPVPVVVAQVNAQLRGWKNYFHYGRPRGAYRVLNQFVVNRFVRHLSQRSQRPCTPHAGQTWYDFIVKDLGVKPLRVATASR